VTEHGSSIRSLVVFSDDWGRHPSSCQHLVRRLLDRYPVCWVNTIGTRRPTLDLKTFRRGMEKLRDWMLPPASQAEELPSNLRVLSPRMWPWVSRPMDRRLNRALLVRALAPEIRDMPQPVAAITTVPVVADLVGELPVAHWTYYCVDDFSSWPGLDSRALDRLNGELLDRADRIVAVSEALVARAAARGRSSHLLTHGVDVDFWSSDSAAPLPEALAAAEKPWITFWGLLDRRLDLAVLRQLSNDLAAGTVVLAGPAEHPSNEIANLSRTLRPGPVAFRALPRLAAESRVLIMPYADLPVTRCMQPLKLKEYLATGRPVVASNLPACRGWADCLDIATSPAEFWQMVAERIRSGLTGQQRAARRRLSGESWQAKAEHFERLAILPVGEAATH